jgi:hypothetical protein
MQVASISFPIGLVAGIAIMAILAISEFYGIRYLRSKDSRKPLLSFLYLAVCKSRVSEFIYNLVMLESPFVTLLAAGLLLGDSEIMLLIASSWTLILGMAVLAVLMSSSPTTHNDSLEIP